MGILSDSGGNSAPNYVPYTDMRVPFALNAVTPARMSNVVKTPMISREQQQNFAPYINGQTYWANQQIVRNAQGQAKRRGKWKLL